MTYSKLASALACGVCIVAMAAPAHAQTRTYNIPAGSLKSALDAYSRQSGRPTIYQADQIRGLRSRGVSGSMSADAALDAILSATPFRGQADSSGAVAIVRVGNAQSLAAPSSATVADDSGDLTLAPEIVVTATKRADRLVQTPIAVSVLQPQVLAQRGAVRLEDLAERAPGLSVTNGSVGGTATGVILRGLATTLNGNPTVAVYIDDSPFTPSTVAGGSSIPDIDPGDLDRIEVLRGPQGTLYGASSLGGLIRYITRAPDFDDTSGRAEGGFAGVNKGDVGFTMRGRINAPLSQNVAITASGVYRQDPGYIDDPAHYLKNFNETRTRGGRVALAVRPAENVTFTVSALHQIVTSDGSSTVDANPATGALLYPDLQVSRVPGTGASRSRLTFVDGTLKASLSGVELVSTTSYSDRNFRSTYDYTPLLGGVISGVFGVPDGGASLLTSGSIKKFTQEVRATSTTPGFFNWQAGVYYTHEKTSQAQQVIGVNTQTGATITGLPELGTGILPNKYEEIAGFGDVTLTFSPKFDITGGIRYSHNSQRSSSIVSGILFGGANTTLGRQSGNQTTFLVNPRFKLSETATLYGRVATGFRPGGPNTGVSGTQASYDSDTVTSYEAGFKGDFLGRALSVDLAAFWVDWKDIQIRAIDPVSGSNYYFNGGGARSKGVEAALVVRPTRGLSISGNAAYTDATIRKGTPSPSFSARGDALPYTPKWATYVAADYSFPIGAVWKGSFGGGYRHVGQRRGEFQPVANLSRFVLPAYDVFDLHAGVSEQSGFGIEVYVRNLTDKRAFTTDFNVGPVEQVAILTPRTIGVTLTKSF